MKNIIKNVVLEIGGKEITVTADEAKELQEALNRFFNAPTVTWTYPGWWLPPATVPYYGSGITWTTLKGNIGTEPLKVNIYAQNQLTS